MMSNGVASNINISGSDKTARDFSSWPTIIGGSDTSHTNGRSCIAKSHRHLLNGLNLAPSEVEALFGLPTEWTLAPAFRLARMQSRRKLFFNS